MGGAVERVVRGSTEIYFRNITKHILTQLTSVRSLCGCIAWLTEPTLLQAMGSMEQCQIVVTGEKFSQRCLQAYESMEVRMLGPSRGRRRPFMHHKFLIGKNADGHAIWMMTGSFNFTLHASQNLEHVVLFRDPEMIASFEREFQLVWGQAKKIRQRRKIRYKPLKRRREK